MIDSSIFADKAEKVEPVIFQPVISPGNYEGEFGVKKNDIIFHFWPHGYHEAEDKRLAKPRFSSKFLSSLKTVVEDSFGANRTKIEFDEELGSYFVHANGWATNPMYKNMCIEFCERLHKLLS